MKRLLLDVVLVGVAVVATAIYMRDYHSAPPPPAGVPGAAATASTGDDSAPRFVRRSRVYVDGGDPADTLNDLLAWSDAVMHVPVRDVRIPFTMAAERRTRVDLPNAEYLADVRSVWATRSAASVVRGIRLSRLGYYEFNGESLLHIFDPDFPEFSESGQFVLFLRAMPDGSHTITGGPRGTFQVLAGRVAPWSNSKLARGVTGMRLEDFQVMLRRVVWPPRGTW